jgi:hypothetical protein
MRQVAVVTLDGKMSWTRRSRHVVCCWLTWRHPSISTICQRTCNSLLESCRFPRSIPNTVGSVVFALHPSGRDPSLRAYTLSQLSSLTQPQRQAVLDVLQFIAANGSDYDRRDASKALERFCTADVVRQGTNTSILVMP